MSKNLLQKIYKLHETKNLKAPTGPHGSEGMAGHHVCGYVRNSAPHMVTKHTIKDV